MKLLHLHSEPVLERLQQQRDLQPEPGQLETPLDQFLDHRMSHWATHIDLRVFSGQLGVL